MQAVSTLAEQGLNAWGMEVEEEVLGEVQVQARSIRTLLTFTDWVIAVTHHAMMERDIVVTDPNPINCIFILRTTPVEHQDKNLER